MIPNSRMEICHYRKLSHGNNWIKSEEKFYVSAGFISWLFLFGFGVVPI